MDKQELASLLARLQRELESGRAIDEQLRQSLQALDQDIQKVLTQEMMAEASDATAAGGAPQDPSLNERAQELEARFAAEHPYLASTLRDVMDQLGKMGI